MQKPMNHNPVIVERTFNAPAEKVWKAISDRTEMKKWYFDLPDFSPEPGFKFTFEGGDENHTFLHLCEVTWVLPGRKLSHSWRYDGYKGNSFVTWELFAEGEGTRVKLTHEGLETFPADNPSFAKANFQAGWADIIGRSLKEYLEG